jgi:hypothetical protein
MLDQIVDNRQRLSMAVKDPKLKTKSFLLLSLSLHKEVDGVFCPVATTTFLETPGLEFHLDVDAAKTLKRADKTKMTANFAALSDLIIEGGFSTEEEDSSSPLLDALGDNYQNLLMVNTLDLSKFGIKQTIA